MEHFCPSYETAISPSYGTPGGSNHTCSIGGTPIQGQWPSYETPKNHCSIAGTPKKITETAIWPSYGTPQEGQIIRVPLVAHQFRVNGPAMEHPKITVPQQEHHILTNTSYGNSKIPYEKIKKTLKFSDFILFPFALSYL